MKTVKLLVVSGSVRVGCVSLLSGGWFAGDPAEAAASVAADSDGPAGVVAAPSVVEVGVAVASWVELANCRVVLGSSVPSASARG